MCKYECLGDYYRGCQHYVIGYYSGNREDCGRQECRTSNAHKHKTARECTCMAIRDDERKVVNMFQFKCETCKENARTSGYR